MLIPVKEAVQSAYLARWKSTPRAPRICFHAAVFSLFAELLLLTQLPGYGNATGLSRYLAPPIHKTIRSFEIYGISVPSGDVGGDLVDVAGDGQSWTGYVADARATVSPPDC